jgi:hypothetical protein
MANRTIEQKKIKMKRRGKHRVYGKQFINTGRGPAPGSVSALYRHKLIEDKVDQYLNAKFPQKYFYSDDALIARNEFDKQKSSLLGEKENPIPLGEVRAMLIRLQEQMDETVMENHFKLRNTSFHKIDLFFSANKTCWEIIEMKMLGGENFSRRSCVYSSKRLAIQALRLSAVEWVETVPLRRLPT